MTHGPDLSALRRLTLAVCVLDEVDLSPDERGVMLLDGAPLLVTWDEVAASLRGADPAHERARLLLGEWFRLRRALARADAESLLRPLGLPVGSVVHPGPAWTRQHVLGGAIELGVGVVLPGPRRSTRADRAFDAAYDEPHDVVLAAPPACLAAAGLTTQVTWPQLTAHAEQMGALAARRLDREPSVLKPMGDCDVVTLLATASLRSALAARDASGMCAAVVPMRRRGWLDPSRTDPAFALAAAAATSEQDRGFDRPVLVTRDEVAVAPAGGRPVEIMLRDPVIEMPHLRAVRWR